MCPARYSSEEWNRSRGSPQVKVAQSYFQRYEHLLIS